MSMSDTVQNGAATDAMDNKKDEIVQIDKVQDGSYNIEENNSLGKVQIADDVVAIIAGLAAGEVEGVYRLTGSIQMSLLRNLARRIRQRESRWNCFREKSKWILL